MKTFLRSLLLVISALLLTGSTGIAQSRDSDRDWIDSLAVTYRTDFIQSEMLRDQAALDSMGARLYVLIFSVQKQGNFKQITINDLVNAIRRYDTERQALQLRRFVYEKEMRSARTNFSPL